MKKFLIIAVFFASSFMTQAQELKWYTDVSEAAKIALDDKKPLLFFFTGSDWCGWCHKLQRDVFAKPEFIKWASKKVILVELDFPKRTPQNEELRAQNQNMQQMFGVRGYPTIWLVQPVLQEGKKVNLDALGMLGYENNEKTWIEKANSFLAKIKK